MKNKLAGWDAPMNQIVYEPNCLSLTAKSALFSLILLSRFGGTLASIFVETFSSISSLKLYLQAFNMGWCSWELLTLLCTPTTTTVTIRTIWRKSMGCMEGRIRFLTAITPSYVHAYQASDSQDAHVTFLAKDSAYLQRPNASIFQTIEPPRGMQGRVSDCLSAVQDCAAHLSKTLECSCQHGKHWREWSDQQQVWKRRGNLLRQVDGRSTHQFHCSPTIENTLCGHSSLQRTAMVRSQSGPLSSVPFTAVPTNWVTRFEAEQFRVLLLRRLRLPLPLSFRSCRCGRLLDALGHHRAACSRSGVLGRRGLAVESAQICRKAVHECPPT